MPSLPTREKPVVLTGYDLEIDCPGCGTKQIVGDSQHAAPLGSISSALAGDEFVALHALPGRYVLNYRLHCWQCTEFFSGRLTIRSRAAVYAGEERRRVWGG